MLAQDKNPASNTAFALLRFRKPWWLPILSLSVTLYGILVLGWSLVPIVFLFWWEVILMVGAALVRTFFALDSRPFWDNFLLKIFRLAAGAVLGGAMIMLSVTFSFKAMENFSGSDGLENIPTQTRIMLGGYVLGLALHYFANGRYKTANPWGEFMQTFVHLLVLLSLLMALTMHLIPGFPQLDQAKWVAVAVVVVKFVVDWLFMKTGKPVRGIFSGGETGKGAKVDNL